MMQTFRNNMKIIFFVLIFFFVGWMAFTLTGLDDYLVQQNRKDYRGVKYAGFVGKEKIDRQAYNDRLRRAVEMASSQRSSGGLSSWEMDQLSDQVWSDIVNDIILGKVLDKRGIKVNDGEVVEYIRTNPLPELMREPALQTDGRFDYDKYLQILADPRMAQLVSELETDARNKIPNLKLFLEVASLYKMTDDELKLNYKAADEKAQVDYVRFVSDSLIADSEVQIGDDEIKKYYDDHPDSFKRPDIAAVTFALLPLLPGSKDSAAARDTLEAVLARYKSGESWDSLAVHYSQDPFASSGGDLGWFAKGDYQDTLMAGQAFNMKPGEVSAPIVVSKGMMILRVDSMKVFDGVKRLRARRIALNIEPSAEQLNAVRARARTLRGLMRQEGRSFEAVVADSALQVKESGSFVIGGQIPGIQAGRDLMDYVYGASEGAVSYPISVLSENQECVALIKVNQRIQSGTVPLEEAADAIRRQLGLDKKKPLAEKKIRALMSDYAQFSSLADFAQAKGLNLTSSPEFTRLSGLAGVGRSNAFIGTAFGLPVGVKSDLVEAGNNFYLLQVNSRTEADMSGFDQAKARLTQQLMGQRMQGLYTLFSGELYSGTKIEDLRKIESDSTTAKHQADIQKKRSDLNLIQ
ncbi:peptidyl-prolyl cis-trans isomerase [bacterium]|nr:peptidyl-prolyl cis-trans isomerase [bacterium]